jgi:hypothetical protein
MVIRVLSLIAALAAGQFGWSMAVADRERTRHLSRTEPLAITGVVGFREAARSFSRAASRPSDARGSTVDRARIDDVSRAVFLPTADGRSPTTVSVDSPAFGGKKIAPSQMSH